MSEEEAKTVKSEKSAKTTATEEQTKAPEAAEEEKPLKPVEEEESCKTFFWNPQKKEVLGRGGKSWMLITLFYIVFFGFLFAFFMMSWYISLACIKHTAEKAPYKIGEKSWLYKNGPGLTFRPIPDRERNKDSSLIIVKPGAHAFWSKQLKKWFSHIPVKDSSGTKPPGTKDCDSGDKADDEACLLIKDRYAPCNDGEFGYDQGQPCILLKLNRIYDWSPGDSYGTLPAPVNAFVTNPQLSQAVPQKSIVIFCQGASTEDKMNLGQIEYYPGPYIDNYYYPYLNQKNYQSPFVMLRLASPTRGTLITIECSAYSDKLKPDKEKKVGYLRFQVIIGA